MTRGVIFDLDGVLVTTDDLHYRAWRQLADEEGIPFTREDNHRLRGVSRMESLEILLERATRHYSTAEKVALAERKNTYYRALLPSLTPDDLLPGARALLLDLRRQGIKIAIGSSSKNARQIMELTGLPPLVDALIDGTHIAASKPDPEVFLRAADALGLPPAACVVVEDAEAGIEAGRRAGIPVFGIGTPESLPNVTPIAQNLAGAEFVNGELRVRESETVA